MRGREERGGEVKREAERDRKGIERETERLRSNRSTTG